VVVEAAVLEVPVKTEKEKKGEKREKREKWAGEVEAV